MSHSPRYEYSTLEVNHNVEHHATYPEVAPDQQLPEVNHNAMGNVPQDFKAEGTYESNELITTPVFAGRPRRICGLRRGTFLLVAIIAAIAIIGGVVGGVVGGLSKKKGSSSHDSHPHSPASNTSSASNSTGAKFIFENTEMATTNYTDQFGNQNYLLVYQMQNGAIYMSTYNSSHQKWVVSPIVDGDGANGLHLDDVQLGTKIAIDVYRHNESEHDIHLYWQAPDNSIKTLFRNETRTDMLSTPQDWSSPFTSDRYTATPGSSIISYGRECDACTVWTYLFFQDTKGVIRGGYLSGANQHGWTDFSFDNIEPPALNTSLVMTNVGALNGTQSLDFFYRTASGVLAIATYDGGDQYWGSVLPRGIDANTSITGWATGWNETGPNNNDPLGFQVLTITPGSSMGVLSTYFDGNTWTAGGEVTALSDCVTKGTIVSSRSARVFCLVDDGGGNSQISEWQWSGNATGNTNTFMNYSKIGIVNTTPS